jgi:hypothetical protein
MTANSINTNIGACGVNASSDELVVKFVDMNDDKENIYGCNNIM